jgi:hypothetical protein
MNKSTKAKTHKIYKIAELVRSGAEKYALKEGFEKTWQVCVV